MAQKIIPNIWFNENAEEATAFYIDAFGDGEITRTDYYPTENLPDFQKEFAGKPLTFEFRLKDMTFIAINAGPEFTPNPSLSFMVNFDPSRDEGAKEQLNNLWNKLIDGGTALMPLQEYPFSKWYGWVQDKYGVSWQLILTDPNGEPRPAIIPALLFGGAAQNRANEAIEYYTSVFSNARKGASFTYDEQTGPATPGSIMFADFMLENQWFVANDSGVEQPFTFNEGISLMVNCKDQAEIDELWSKLSHVPEAEQCGWCKDKFGVSWQIVPGNNMDELMKTPGAWQILLKQKKIIIAEYEQ